MQSLVVDWGKCGEYFEWCSFDSLDLTDPLFKELEGVYIIWKDRHVIYVGSGLVADQLRRHRQQPAITRFFPELKVTWARIPNETQRLGVEHFLIESLYPKVRGATPSEDQVKVNYPW